MEHICPYCGAKNTEDETTLKSTSNAFLPPLAGALAGGALSAADKRAGLIVGGILTLAGAAYAIVHHRDGKKITCWNCQNDFKD